jgi:hypothetical protein
VGAANEVKITVRLPVTVHGALTEEVGAGHWTSLNGLIVHCCSEYVRSKQSVPLNNVVEALHQVFAGDPRVDAVLSLLDQEQTTPGPGAGGGAGGGE